MAKLSAAWYILLYHEVSWEENLFLRSIGGTTPPDLFRSHVMTCAKHGELVSIEEGLQRLEANDIDRPLFSFWFDDGLTGVRKYAAPILREFHVTGGLSICSRFALRSEFFWRFKLSYLNSIDAMRIVRSRLRKFGYRSGESVKLFTIDQFSPELLACLDDIFMRFTTAEERSDAFRIFDDSAGIRSLHDRGWTVGNHSACHYPIGQAHSVDHLEQQFLECEQFLIDCCGVPTRFWVVPFDRNTVDDIDRRLDASRDARWIVLVGNKVNRGRDSVKRRVLYRMEATPWTDGSGLMRFLSNVR